MTVVLFAFYLEAYAYYGYSQPYWMLSPSVKMLKCIKEQKHDTMYNAYGYFFLDWFKTREGQLKVLISVRDGQWPILAVVVCDISWQILQDYLTNDAHSLSQITNPFPPMLLPLCLIYVVIPSSKVCVKCLKEISDLTMITTWPTFLF